MYTIEKSYNFNSLKKITMIIKDDIRIVKNFLNNKTNTKNIPQNVLNAIKEMTETYAFRYNM